MATPSSCTATSRDQRHRFLPRRRSAVPRGHCPRGGPTTTTTGRSAAGACWSPSTTSHPTAWPSTSRARWVADVGGSSAVRGFGPDGNERGRIPVPATMVTSVCFGGADRRDVYIVTADNTRTPTRAAASSASGPTSPVSPWPRPASTLRCGPRVASSTAGSLVEAVAQVDAVLDPDLQRAQHPRPPLTVAV